MSETVTYMGSPIKVGDELALPKSLVETWGVDKAPVLSFKPGYIVVGVPMWGRVIEIDIPAVKDKPKEKPKPVKPVRKYQKGDEHLGETVKYVDTFMDEAPDLKVLPDEPDYELYVRRVWVRVKGRLPESLRILGKEYQRKVMINCFAVRMPVLFIHECVIAAHQRAAAEQGPPAYRTRDEYVKYAGAIKTKERPYTLWGYNPDYPATLQECIDRYLDDNDDATVAGNKLTRELLEGRLQPMELRLLPVSKQLRRSLCAIPLLPSKAVIESRVHEWGFFC